MGKKREVKTKKNFLTELYNRYSKPFQKKYYYYFLWRNKLRNSKTDLSILTEEEFIEKYLKKNVNGKLSTGIKSFNSLQMWEQTEEYQLLMQEFYNFKMNQDFYKLYETYLAKAMEGDEKALNSLKLIKKEIESLNKVTKVKSSDIGEGAKFDLS